MNEDNGTYARRDRYVVAVANAVLRLASKRYRGALKSVVLRGLELPKPAQDETEAKSSPVSTASPFGI